MKISDALDDQPGLRMIYCDGRLVFAGESRRHDWFAERLGEFVKAMARGLGIPWEDAGGATFRRENMYAGLEGDKTFYFGEHAVLMRGPLDIDLAAQPPPDLAVEVEVSHSADAAVVAWGRPWRFRSLEVSAQDGRVQDSGFEPRMARTQARNEASPFRPYRRRTYSNN